jgi:hypothetical protein
MLALTHNANCGASAFEQDMILIDSIIARKKLLQKKFDRKSGAVSKFYGCFTTKFAQTWSRSFGVKAAGAEQKVDFGVVDRKSDISNIMERIEKTPTSLGSPDWTVFGSAP